MNELNMLKLKNLIVNKEFINTQANNDLNMHGKFTCDYITPYGELNEQINNQILLIEKVNNRKSPPPLGSKPPEPNLSDSNVVPNENNKSRKYIFETYLGENFDTEPYDRCPIDVALKHQCSRLNDDYNALKSMYNRASKVKVTIEFIEENL
ncbi:MAG: hypothetical protein K2X69_10695 [Silvanigrellaceae bacterium]|nr:hypothetical protein [Silvanigrellaceae bacterium]